MSEASINPSTSKKNRTTSPRYAIPLTLGAGLLAATALAANPSQALAEEKAVDTAIDPNNASTATAGETATIREVDLETAKSDLDNATADLEAAKNEQAAAEDAVNQAQSNYDQAIKDEQTAKDNFEAAQEAAEGVTDEAIQEAQDAVDAAKPAYDEALENHNAAQDELNAAQEAADEAEVIYTSTSQQYEEAETALKDANDALNEAETQFNEAEKAYNEALANASDEALAQATKELEDARNAYNEAQSAYEQAKANAEEADRALSVAESLLAEKQDALKAAQATAQEIEDQLARARQDYADAEKALEDANNTLTQLNEKLTAAEQAYNDAMTKADQAENELEQARADKEAADQTYTNTQTALKEAEATLKAAEEKLDSLGSGATIDQEAYDQGIFGFLEYLEDNGSTDAIKQSATNALALLENCTYTDAVGDGSGTSATSIANIEKAIDIFEKLNQLRARLGLPEYKTTYEYLAMAIAQADYCENIGGLNHNGQFSNSAENLAQGYSNPINGWYDQEKRVWNSYVEAGSVPESIVNAVNSGTLSVYDLVTFAMSNQEIYLNTGHYLNIMVRDFEVVGLAVNSAGNYWAQDFGQRAGTSAITIDELKATLTAYIDSITLTNDDYEKAQQAYNDAKDTYDAAVIANNTASTAATNATNAFNDADQKCTDAQTAKNNAEATYTDAQDAYDAQETVVSNLKGELEAIRADIVQLENDLASANGTVNAAESEVTAAKNDRDELQADAASANSALTAAGNTLNDASVIVKEKEDALKALDTTGAATAYDQAKQALEAAKSNQASALATLNELAPVLNTAADNYRSTQATLVQAKESASTAEEAYLAAKAIYDDAVGNYNHLVELNENELVAANDYFLAQAAVNEAYKALLEAQANLEKANAQLSTSYETYVDALMIYQAAQDREDAAKANQAVVTTADIENVPVASAGFSLPKTADPNTYPATGLAAILAASGIGAIMANRRKLKNRRH